MRKFKFVWVLAVILAGLLVGSCAKGYAIDSGDKAPDFTLTDLNGNKVSFSQFSGKVVILDFFASWCPPCRQEIPDFIALQSAYADKGVSIVGVALVSLDEAKKFAAQIGINYPVLIDDDKASALYGPVRSIPTTFVIGKDDKVAKKYIGYKAKDVFENDIKELMK